jgi:hypothetical protein
MGALILFCKYSLSKGGKTIFKKGKFYTTHYVGYFLLIVIDEEGGLTSFSKTHEGRKLFSEYLKSDVYFEDISKISLSKLLLWIKK